MGNLRDRRPASSRFERRSQIPQGKDAPGGEGGRRARRARGRGAGGRLPVPTGAPSPPLRIPSPSPCCWGLAAPAPRSGHSTVPACPAAPTHGIGPSAPPAPSWSSGSPPKPPALVCPPVPARPGRWGSGAVPRAGSAHSGDRTGAGSLGWEPALPGTGPFPSTAQPGTRWSQPHCLLAPRDTPVPTSPRPPHAPLAPAGLLARGGVQGGRAQSQAPPAPPMCPRAVTLPPPHSPESRARRRCHGCHHQPLADAAAAAAGAAAERQQQRLGAAGAHGCLRRGQGLPHPPAAAQPPERGF